nr:ribonuclease H-like domain-containing protein [Tanacetum cinerariifolium]
MYNVTLSWIIDSGANQHMNDSTKDMFNSVDISSLMFTAGHHNGTLAKITTIGSLRLTSGIVLELWHCRLGQPADQAKQTRETFLLSDHNSKCFGDIAHWVDVWGPYRVVSKDRVASDDCYITTEDKAATIATQIGENVTCEENVHNNKNGQDPTNVLETSPVLRKSSRQRNSPSKLNDFVVDNNVRYELSGSLPNLKCVEAVNLKMEAFHRNNTYVPADLPLRRKAIGCKCIWKIKYKSSCEVDRKYCLELLCEYGLLSCKPAATPLQQNVALNYVETDNDKFLPNMFEYQKKFANLYISITRPDISYVVHCLSEHMHAPLKSHFTATLRVLRYPKNAPGTGVHFYKSKRLSLHAYSDADWAKCHRTRKSVSGFCLYLCNNLVLWKSKKQATISRSSVEFEYKCLASTTCELIWFEIDLHLVREKVSSVAVKIIKVASANNVVVIFTKGLTIAQYNEFCENLGRLICLNHEFERRC